MTRPALDAFLAFSDGRRCEQAPAHSEFLKAMVAGDEGSGVRPGEIRVPARLAPAFGRVQIKRTKNWTTISVPVRGTLFGLPLVEISQDFPVGGDPPEVSYSFAAPTKVLEHAANRHGIPARAGHVVPLGSDGAYELSVYIAADRSHAGRSVLTCDIG